MVSLGGLDVAYGANTQITRTTVLCVASDGTPTQANAATVHTLAQEKFPNSLRPDYTCFLGTDKAVGYSAALTHQVENGLLKDLTKVPVAGARFQAADATNNRMPSIEAILSVGAVVPATNDTAAADDLFDEAATSGMQVAELTTGASLQSQLMASQMAFQAADTGMSLGVAGNAGVQTLDYTSIFDDTAFRDADGSSHFTEISTIGTLTEGSKSSTGSTSAALLDIIGGKSLIISVVALTTLR